MALEITKEPAMYTHEGPRMFLTADRSRAVPEGDPAAAFLLVGTGCQLSTEEARQYGLLDVAEEAKAAQPKANKSRPAPANKGA